MTRQQTRLQSPVLVLLLILVVLSLSSSCGPVVLLLTTSLAAAASQSPDLLLLPSFSPTSLGCRNLFIVLLLSSFAGRSSEPCAFTNVKHLKRTWGTFVEHLGDRFFTYALCKCKLDVLFDFFCLFFVLICCFQQN